MSPRSRAGTVAESRPYPRDLDYGRAAILPRASEGGGSSQDGRQEPHVRHQRRHPGDKNAKYVCVHMCAHACV